MQIEKDLTEHVALPPVTKQNLEQAELEQPEGADGADEDDEGLDEHKQSMYGASTESNDASDDEQSILDVDDVADGDDGGIMVGMGSKGSMGNMAGILHEESGKPECRDEAAFAAAEAERLEKIEHCGNAIDQPATSLIELSKALPMVTARGGTDGRTEIVGGNGERKRWADVLTDRRAVG